MLIKKLTATKVFDWNLINLINETSPSKATLADTDQSQTLYMVTRPKAPPVAIILVSLQPAIKQIDWSSIDQTGLA